jgi:hypothetical protein
LPRALIDLIARKSEGNPFFVEEVVRSLRETGAIEASSGRFVLGAAVDRIHVPDTVQDIIAARIDRLADDPKRALQVASVIGREFTRRMLGRLAGTRGDLDGVLRELAAIELIREKDDPRGAGPSASRTGAGRRRVRPLPRGARGGRWAGAAQGVPLRPLLRPEG